MKHILIVGCGSIGRRHLRNYKELGCEVSAVDPRGDRLGEANKEVKLEYSLFKLEEILELSLIEKINGIVIATPPKFHFEQCIEVLKHNIPIFLEKPGTKTLTESQVISQNLHFNPDKLLMGYCYRWWPSILKLRDDIQNGRVGKVQSGNFIISAHLEDWHPWEPYKDFFLANKELGGGALLDENHFVDLMIWFWGMPASVTATLRTIGGFDIDVEDCVDMIFEYEDRKIITMHLDMLARPHEKSIVVRGDKGTLEWHTTNDYEHNWIQYANTMVWEADYDAYDRFKFDRNDMFISEAQEFLGIIDGQAKASCTLDDGIRVLQLVEAAKLSSEEGRMVGI